MTDKQLLIKAAYLLRRYRKETPLGHQPHMISLEADAAIAALDAAIAQQFTAADDTPSKSRMARVAIEKAAEAPQKEKMSPIEARRLADAFDPSSSSLVIFANIPVVALALRELADLKEAAIAKPAVRGEPVAWIYEERYGHNDDEWIERINRSLPVWETRKVQPLYTRVLHPDLIADVDLHPATKGLVLEFARALALKLSAAEKKYGYAADWLHDDWREECQRQLTEHVAKGDPRDVAAYCAFAWFHEWPTVAAQPVAQPPNAQQVAQTGVPEDSLGDNAQFIDKARALLSLDASGSLVPHGIGGLARQIIESAIRRLDR